MADIQKYFSNFLPKQQIGIAQSIVGSVSEDFYYLELIISIQQSNINVKEFSSYLTLIYKLDGLMSNESYNKYSHNYESQIKIDDVRIGSCEIVIQKVLTSIEADKLAIIWLVLKYLGTIFITATSSTLLFYKTLNQREEYLDKRDRRLLRKNIRELIEEEVEISKLEKNHKAKLVNTLDELYVKNKKLIPSASRFVKHSVKSVKLSPKKK